jgi:DNA-binding transcriptional regulator GbsR (MarR family)
VAVLPTASAKADKPPASAPDTDSREAAGTSSGLTWRLVRSDGRAPEVVAFEESVVEFFLEAAELLGVPKSLAAIYGICFASPEPLCYSDVRERLNVSAGSVSQGLRILREVGALKVVAAPALDRREFFVPDLALRKLVVHYLEERVEKQLDSGRGRLNVIIKAIPAGENGGPKILKTRLKALQTWHDKTRKLLPVAKGFLRF